MLRHLVLFRFSPDATDEQKATVIERLSELPSVIPQIRSYRVGPDAGLVDGNWEMAVAADFDSVDDWRTYVAHALHQRVISESIRPILAERAAVQIEF